MMLLTHVVFWGALVTVCMSGVKNVWEVVAICTVTAIIAGGCYMMRRRMKSRVLFFLLHIVLAAFGIWFILQSDLMGGYCAILIAMLLWSVVLRCFHATAWLEEPTHVYTGVIAFVLIIIGKYKAMYITQMICASSIVLLYLFKQFYHNLVQIERYVDTRSFGTNADSTHAKNLCKQIATLFFGIFSCVIFLLGITKIAGIGTVIERWVYELWRTITSNFKLDPSEVPFMIGGMSGNTSPGGMFEDLVGEQKTSPFVEFMSDVLLIGGELLIAAAVIFGVIKLFITVFRSFRNREIEKEGNVFVEKLAVEAKSTKMRKKRIDAIKGSGPAKQIRRIYKKRMTKIAQEEVEKFSHMAPKLQVQCLKEPDYDASTRKEIREIYEKARYGEDIVSNKDVEKMGTLF